MPQLSKGHTFVPGEVVDPADLNNLVDLATAEAGLITEQLPNVPATGTDKVMVSRSGVLHSALVSSLPSGVTSVSVTIDSGASVLSFSVGTPSTTPVFHIGLDDQGPNKVLAGPASGGATTPRFRALTPADLPSATVVDIPANNIIDCTAGVIFFKTLPTGTGAVNLSISGLADGQTIKVNAINSAAGNRTISWAVTSGTPAIIWRGGGPAPVLTQQPNARDIFTFTRLHNFTYGYADQRFTG